MDAFAAKQLQKRKLQEEKERKKAELENKPSHEKMTQEEKESLNRAFGYPDPPEVVYAIGKNEAAAVWWPYTCPVGDDDETKVKENGSSRPRSKSKTNKLPLDYALGWEVHRYRKDKSKPNGDWTHKGYTAFKSLEKTQVIIESLSNDYEYRFTVKCINAKGTGHESYPSNPVMVEAPLPAGWYRFHNTEQGKHYYANVKLNLSLWSRPETDPYFLDEAILLNFEPHEIETLKALYDEDIAHFKCVSVNQFMDILSEIGEKCRKGWIEQLFRGYAKDDERLVSWTHFMEIMNHIKKHRVDQGEVLSRPIVNFLLWISRSGVKKLMQPKAVKMGDWRTEYSALACRNFYKNTLTGESYWSMPAQVKFYIPPKLEAKLLKVFDYGQIEEFQQHFSLLDVDNSGDLSPAEIRILLTAMKVQVTDKKFQKLIRTIDLNGNGTIEFDEYCWMMYEIYRKDGKENGLFSGMQDSKVKKKPSQKGKDKNNKSNSNSNSAVTQKTDDTSESAINVADNSYIEDDNSIYVDKSFSGKLNFYTVNSTILGFRENYSNSHSMRYRIPEVFRSFKRAASFRLITGSQRAAALTDQRRASINSLNGPNDNNNSNNNININNNTQVALNNNFMRQFAAYMTNSTISIYRTLTLRNTAQHNLLSRFDDTKIIEPSTTAVKKRNHRLSFLSRGGNGARSRQGSVMSARASFGYFFSSFGYSSFSADVDDVEDDDKEDEENKTLENTTAGGGSDKKRIDALQAALKAANEVVENDPQLQQQQQEAEEEQKQISDEPKQPAKTSPQQANSQHETGSQLVPVPTVIVPPQQLPPSALRRPSQQYTTPPQLQRPQSQTPTQGQGPPSSSSAAAASASPAQSSPSVFMPAPEPPISTPQSRQRRVSFNNRAEELCGIDANNMLIITSSPLQKSGTRKSLTLSSHNNNNNCSNNNNNNSSNSNNNHSSNNSSSNEEVIGPPGSYGSPAQRGVNKKSLTPITSTATAAARQNTTFPVASTNTNSTTNAAVMSPSTVLDSPGIGTGSPASRGFIRKQALVNTSAMSSGSHTNNHNANNSNTTSGRSPSGSPILGPPLDASLSTGSPSFRMSRGTSRKSLVNLSGVNNNNNNNNNSSSNNITGGGGGSTSPGVGLNREASLKVSLKPSSTVLSSPSVTDSTSAFTRKTSSKVAVAASVGVQEQTSIVTSATTTSLTASATAAAGAPQLSQHSTEIHGLVREVSGKNKDWITQSMKAPPFDPEVAVAEGALSHSDQLQRELSAKMLSKLGKSTSSTSLKHSAAHPPPPRDSPASRRSSGNSKKVRPAAAEQEESDSDDDDDDNDDGEDDDGSSVKKRGSVRGSFLSLARSISSVMLGSGEGVKSDIGPDGKKHGKHCMCGCRNVAK